VEELNMTLAENKQPFYKSLLLPLNLQLFADNGSDGGDGGNGDGGNGDNGDNNGDNGQDGNGTQTNSLNLDELMKDPAFKAQYQAKLQNTLNTRLKKYEGIDLEEYNRLKQAEQDKQDAELTDLQKKEREIEKLQGKIQSISDREKALAVKEFCVDKGYNAKLVSRLINLSSVKEVDGAYQGIDEAIQELATEFPEVIKVAGQQQDNQQNQQQNQQNSYSTGANQRQNQQRQDNPYETGKSIAEQRNQARLAKAKQFNFGGGNE
jgi:hypothetical protein